MMMIRLANQKGLDYSTTFRKQTIFFHKRRPITTARVNIDWLNEWM